MSTDEIRAALDAHDAEDAALRQSLTDTGQSLGAALRRVAELEAQVDRLTHPEKVLIGADWSPFDVVPSSVTKFMTRIDTDRGPTIRTTLPQSTAGPRWTFPLPEPMDEGYIEYDIRSSGFPWGKGAKYGPGLGGILPGNPEGRTSPPSGGTPTEWGWSVRLMVNTAGGDGIYPDAANYSLYRYLPTLPKSSYGEGLQAPGKLGTATKSDDRWRRVRVYVGMNVIGRADGVSRLLVDGQPVLDQLETWRTHDGVQVTHGVWSQFYGGDSAWAGVGGGVIDIANLRIVKVR